MHTIIRGGRLLDIEGHSAEPADILIENGTIRSVGPPGMDAPSDAALRDATGRLLMPGLVNSHTHGHNNLARSFGDRWNLELLLNAAPWITGSRTLEDKYLSTLIGAVEMVRKGCTAAYDLNFEFPAPTPEGLEAIGRAYADAGMRAVVAPMMADRTFYQAVPGLLDALPDAERRDAEAVAVEPFGTSLAAWNRALRSWPFSRDRVRLALAPTIPHHCSEAFLRAASEAAAEHGVGFHTHLGESKVQAHAGVRLYGMTQTAYLDRIGVLGPDFTAAHAVWLDGDDMRRIADAGGAVAHNPGSNARLGSGLAAARALLDAGVRVGIGTDACTCSDNLNMFEAMRVASMVSRVQEL
ncbi:MAG: amidohydrolase family protein, partial [Alphaproteobacteria bacterium]|nr:amidohydrolase family protein [Alphaproteobacteria bacterium]